MSIATAIVTCDRTQFGRPNCGRRMWASFVASGALAHIVARRLPLAIFDAGPPSRGWGIEMETLTRVQVYGGEAGSECLKSSHNEHRALAWAATQGCDYVLMIEDDTIFCKNFLPRVEVWLNDIAPRDGMVYSLATQYRWVGAALERGVSFVAYPPEEFYLTAAVVLPTEAVRSYLVSERRHRADRCGQGFDLLLAEHVTDCGGSIYAHCPSLALHVDFQGTLGRPQPHQTEAEAAEVSGFPGEAYDAMEGTS